MENLKASFVHLRSLDSIITKILDNWDAIKINKEIQDLILNKQIQNQNSKQLIEGLIRLLRNEMENIFNYVLTAYFEDNTFAILIMGLIYDKLGNKEEAKQYYEQAAKKKNGFAYYGLYKLTNDMKYLKKSIKLKCSLGLIEHFNMLEKEGKIEYNYMVQLLKINNSYGYYFYGKDQIRQNNINEGYDFLLKAYELGNNVATLYLYKEFISGINLERNIELANDILMYLCNLGYLPALEIAAFKLLNRNQQEMADDILEYLYVRNYRREEIGMKLSLINHSMADTFLNS